MFKGKLYQNYIRPPLDKYEAAFNTTKEKADLISPYTEGKTVLDVGCANGALLLELKMRGAGEARGIDHDADAINNATAAMIAYKANVDFLIQNTEKLLYMIEHWDVILFMSVWKWIQWREGLGMANHVLERLAAQCDRLIFEPGIADAGTDLGSPISRTEVPRLICENTDFKHIEMLGVIKDNDHAKIRREIWNCWR